MERRHPVYCVPARPRALDTAALRLCLGPGACPYPLARGARPGRFRAGAGGAVPDRLQPGPGADPGALRRPGPGRVRSGRGARRLACAVGRGRRCDDLRRILRHPRRSAHDRGTAARDRAHPPPHGAARSPPEIHRDALRRQRHGVGAGGRRACDPGSRARPERARARTQAGRDNRAARHGTGRVLVAVLGRDGGRLSTPAGRADMVGDGARPRPRGPCPCPGASHGRRVPGRDADGARRPAAGGAAGRGRGGHGRCAGELRAPAAARSAAAGNPAGVRRRPGTARPARHPGGRSRLLRPHAVGAGRDGDRHLRVRARPGPGQRPRRPRSGALARPGNPPGARGRRLR